MEYLMLEELSKIVKNNKKAALAMITRIQGSTPRKEGSMMLVLEDGTIRGTIGGGVFESVVINKSIKCIKEGKSRGYHFELNDNEGGLHMQCGGDADVFIRVFGGQDKLLIVGGGHIAQKLQPLAKMLGFYTVIFEDREEFCNHNIFPDADELQLGNIKDNLKDYPIDSNSYIVLVTRGHANDEVALREVLNRGSKYIGMIGSTSKTDYIMNKLIGEGFERDTLDEVYSPIGLKLGGEAPIDIAFSIMAEIQAVKHGGTGENMRRI